MKGQQSPERFDTLALDLAVFQAEFAPGFARLCKARGVDLAALTNASEIPAVPTDAFKLTRVSTFDSAEPQTVFRTSGTTADRRGEHFVHELATYDSAAVAFGKRWLARDLEARCPVLVLSPSPEESPDSSLVHMCELFARAWGEGEPRFFVEDGVIDLSMLDQAVTLAEARRQPVVVLGTSFAFVHLLDALGEASFTLPQGSRVMQTGGFKGKSREVPAESLRADLARVFGIPAHAIVSEYGMTELSSQFYEQTLFEPGLPHGIYAEPPWARVEPVDPETLAAVAPGEVGIAKIIDLMNVDSAVAVLTQDRVRRVPLGFELLGRLPGAPPRGCSIAIDELLGR